MWQSWVDSISKLENLISKTKEMAQMAGPDPIWTTCPNCNTEILTTTQKSFSTFQCLFAGGLCLFSCFCIFWIPLFIDEWKDLLHSCPNCNYPIGKYKKIWWNHKWNQQKKQISQCQQIFFQCRNTTNKVCNYFEKKPSIVHCRPLFQSG